MKYSRVLIKFLSAIAFAITFGILLGRYVSLQGVEISLTPVGYMKKFVYLAPLYLLPVVAGVLICLIRVKRQGNAGRLPRILTVWVYTVVGIIVSGFCGLYTMKNFPAIAVGLIAAFLLLIALVILDNRSIKHIHPYKTKKRATTFAQKAVFALYGATVLFSAFLPTGPVPVIVVGVVWLTAGWLKK